MSLREQLLSFSPSSFIEKATQELTTQVKSRGSSGAVLGASGGIDSLVAAALCCRASQEDDGWSVFALQMNDARVRGECYNPELYRELGAQIVQIDITQEAKALASQQHLPPYWLTLLLTKGVLRGLPLSARRKAITAAMAGHLPAWGLKHCQALTLLHRVRAGKIREFAARSALLVVICANLTEASLGYFVEQGIDDLKMGDHAPLLEVYKTWVRQVAQALQLPEQVIRQRPSPGFGGIGDEEILGPYALIDQVLLGLAQGYTDESIAQATEPAIGDLSYVRFIRQLAELAVQKTGRNLSLATS